MILADYDYSNVTVNCRIWEINKCKVVNGFCKVLGIKLAC